MDNPNQIPQLQTQEQISVQDIVSGNEPTHKKFIFFVIFCVISILIFIFFVFYTLRSSNITSRQTSSSKVQNIVSLSPTITPDFFNTQDTLLMTITDSKNLKDCVFSLDGRKVACIKDVGTLATASGSGQEAYTVIVDGKQEKTYDRITNLTFSPDSQQLAYTAESGKDWFLVDNGKESNPYEYIAILKFSPDSKHIAIVIGKGLYESVNGGGASPATKYASVVLDGIQGKQYDGIGAAVSFSFEQQLTASQSANTPGFYNFYYPNGYDPIFSGDSKNLVYSAFGDGKTYLIFNGKEILSFPQSTYPTNPLINQDGSKIIYTPPLVDTNGNSTELDIINNSGQLLTKYSAPIVSLTGYISINKDATHVAYVASSNSINQYVLYKDNNLIASTNGLITNVQLSHSGNNLVYVVSNGVLSDNIIYNNIQLDTINGLELSTFSFSPDERYIAYRKESTASVPRDGRAGELDVSDGKKLCRFNYKGWSFEQNDDQQVQHFAPPVFSTDNKFVGIGFITGDQLWWKVFPLDFSQCESII